MDRNDLISRSELKKAITNWFATERYYHPLEKPENLSEVRAMTIVDSVPTVPLPDFKAGYKQAILDGKTNYGGQVVPDALHGWIYEDKQITIEEYMQSLKGENQ